MDTRQININGNNQEFVMGFVEELNLPTWNTIMDELWLTLVNNSIHKYFSTHMDDLIDKNLSNSMEYAITMTLDNFKKAILGGEAIKFRDFILSLADSVRQYEPGQRVYICFYSASSNSDHFISAMVDGQFVILGSHMSNIQIE